MWFVQHSVSDGSVAPITYKEARAKRRIRCRDPFHHSQTTAFPLGTGPNHTAKNCSRRHCHETNNVWLTYLI